MYDQTMVLICRKMRLAEEDREIDMVTDDASQILKMISMLKTKKRPDSLL